MSETVVLKITNEPEYIEFSLYESEEFSSFNIKNISSGGMWTLWADNFDNKWEVTFNLGNLSIESSTIIGDSVIDKNAREKLNLIADGAKQMGNDIPLRVLALLYEALEQKDEIIDISEFVSKGIK